MISRSGWTRAWRLAVLVGVVIVVYAAGAQVEHGVRSFLGPVDHPWLDFRVWIVALLFILLLAIPYVPGMEVSVALLIVLGSSGAVLVYGSTLVALSLSFTIGRRVPTALLCKALAWLHLHKAHDLVARVHPLPPEEKLALLMEAAPARWVPYLLRHRHLALVVLLNLPGNALLGGGGGIAMFAGASGLFRFRAFLLAIAIAALPIPLIVWLFGAPVFRTEL